MARIHPDLARRMNKLHTAFGHHYECPKLEAENLNHTVINRQMGNSMYDSLKRIGMAIAEMIDSSPKLLYFYHKHYPNARFQPVDVSKHSEHIKQLSTERFGRDFS